MNKKYVYRIYREEGLAVRRKKCKRVAVARQRLPVPTRLNKGWGMNFVSGALRGGRGFRELNVLGVLGHEGLASEVDTSLPAKRGVRALDESALERGYPDWMTLDTGPEFQSDAFDAGLTSMVCGSRSSIPASQSRTRWWRATTAGCATSA